MKKALLTTCLIYTILFLAYTQVQFGQTESISKTADYLTDAGRSYLFFMFVWLLGVTFAYVGNSTLSAIAAGLITIIGTVTGYNPEILNDKNEFILHVVCATGSILLIMLDTLNKSFKGRKYVGTVLVGLFCLSAVFIQLTVNNPIYWIEVSAILTIFVYYYDKSNKKD